MPVELFHTVFCEIQNIPRSAAFGQVGAILRDRQNMWGRIAIHHYASSRSRKWLYRFLILSFFRAMANAFFVPIITTSFLPRVTAV